MDRLTERNGDSVFILSKVTGWTRSSNWSEPAENAIHRLAAYEDSGLSPEEVQELAQAKAEGRLVVLPVKVGDTVYSINEPENKAIIEWIVDGLFWYGDGEITIGLHNNGMCWNIGSKSQLGKKVFLSRKEAERALEAKRRGGKRDE